MSVLRFLGSGGNGAEEVEGFSQELEELATELRLEDDALEGSQTSHAALTAGVHGITNSGQLVYTDDPRLDNPALYFSVLDYGADPTGVTDSVVAFRDAHQAARDAGGGTVFAPAGTYRFVDVDSSAGLNWHVALFSDNVHVLLAPGCTIHAEGNAFVFVFFGYSKVNGDPFQWEPNYRLEQDWDALDPLVSYDVGDRTVTLDTAADTANYSVGDLVFVCSGSGVKSFIYPNGLGTGQDGEVNEVESINAGAGTITLRWPLSRPLAQEYWIGASVPNTVSESFTTRVEADGDDPAPFAIQNIEDITLRNVGIHGYGAKIEHPNGHDHEAIHFFGAVGVIAEGYEYEGTTGFWGSRDLRFVLIRDIRGEINNDEGLYWGPGSTFTDAVIERVVTTNRQGTATHLLHESCANVTERDMKFISPPNVAVNQWVLAVSDRCYNIVLDSPHVINGGSAPPIIVACDQLDQERGNILINPRCEGKTANANWGRVSGRWELRGQRTPGDKGIQVFGLVSIGSTERESPIGCLTAMLHVTEPYVVMGWLPANAYVMDVRVHVNQAFNDAGTDVINVGTVADTDRFVSALDVSSSGVKAPTLLNGGRQSTAAEIVCEYIGSVGGASAGQAIVIIEFVRVPTGVV